ncbi:hypothetical protein QF042_002022 [Pedobacter sp. W3I1]|uniref:RagB/SusD family nutrient uptake outer membrane protein n=1 Tax=Pedobacter sp. W3I1 TaxID=3042291 RepID=UPI002786BAFA|nr:RagB/SusD family nutrient uptake outer membrane protein [Pedobacter sp. W3I1]MDQ0638457.1 hypothetical protein [Pedobacter sp. W3I1]
MRKYIYAMLAFVILAISCSKNLDTNVVIRDEISTYFKTPDQINGALIDAYNVLQRENIIGPLYILGDIASDDGLKGGETIGDWADIEQYVENRPMAVNSVGGNFWASCYALISKSNLVIDRIDNVADFGGNNALKARYRSEALFLRAFGYSYLAMAYGDVPIITAAVIDYKNIDAKLLNRKPVAELWALVEKDLAAAVPGLATAAQLKADSQLGRISKGAAQALLAKAFMFQRKYDAAQPVLKDLIDNGGYSLQSDYGKVFRQEGEFGNENIFEVNFIKQDGGWGESCEGSVRNVQQMSRDDWGWGFNQPTQDLINDYEPGDPRIIYTVNFSKDQYVSGTEQKNSQNNVYGYHSRKAFLLPSERPSSASCAGTNNIIFRLSDIYLLYAEALIQGNPKNPATALFYLNEVRKRANTTPKIDPERVFQFFTVASNLLPMRTYSTDAQLLNDIWHERRVELAMEGQRYWDLIRTKRTSLLKDYYQNWGVSKGFEVKGDLKGKFYTQWISQLGKDDYPTIPIPQSEIDKSQGNLQQTKGY